MKTEATWTISNGSEAKVTVELITKKVVWADGHEVDVDCCDIKITASVEGMGIIGDGFPRKSADSRLVANIGKLGITADNMPKVKAAIDAIKATPEWTAKEAKEAAALVAEKEYWSNLEKIENAMTLNGTSY